MIQINNSEQAFGLLKIHFNRFAEEFWVLTLDSQLCIINTTLISRGTLNFCLVHPRDLFRQSLRDNAYTIIIAHNHPSLNLQPTVEDIRLTKRLVKIAQLIEIPIVDHIIFSDENFFSFKQHELI